ncbi:hypothetical protein V3Q90_11770 [Flavobacterium oreochromis]|uniref:WG containing repeat-containing protein n=1 Tax=Flavobacterium oreochromis TaxID=2906078 RepID=A0ABW8P4M4_9FLAO
MLKHLIKIIFLFHLNAYTQKVFENKNITNIIIEDNGIRFFKKTKNNTYNRIDLDIQLASQDKSFNYEWFENNDNISYDEMAGTDYVIKKEDIIPIEKNKLLQQLKHKTFSVIDDDNNRYSYFFAHPSYFLQVNYDLDDEKFKKYNSEIYGDFISTDTKACDYYIIDLGQKKFIIYIDGINEAIICNTKKGLKMFSEKLNFETFSKNPINFNELAELSNPKYIRSHFLQKYFIKKNVNHKYIVKDRYDQTVLNQEFDTLQFKRYFIVGKIKDEYKIYNGYLKKLPLQKAKSVYEYNNGLEVIQDNKLTIYDIDGNILSEKFPHPIDFGCGLMSYWEDFFLTQKDSLYNNLHFLKVIKHKHNYNSVQKNYILKNIPVLSKIYFGDYKLTSYYDSRPKYNNFYYNHNLLIVKMDNKYGLYLLPDLEIENTTENKNFNQLQMNPDNLLEKEIELQNLIPVNYDSISVKTDRIIFSKDGLFGIYGINKEPEFKILKPETNNYYRVTDVNDRKGWLSFYEKKVFWDN